MLNEPHAYQHYESVSMLAYPMLSWDVAGSTVRKVARFLRPKPNLERAEMGRKESVP